MVGENGMMALVAELTHSLARSVVWMGHQTHTQDISLKAIIK